jgi:hypothetical protein
MRRIFGVVGVLTLILLNTAGCEKRVREASIDKAALPLEAPTAQRQARREA